MHTGISKKAHDMKARVVLYGKTNSCNKRVIFEKRSVGNCHVYARKILIHDPAGADIKMTRLRVAVLIGRKSYCFPRGGQLRMGIRTPEARNVLQMYT
jgi:hypothetical protein